MFGHTRARCEGQSRELQTLQEFLSRADYPCAQRAEGPRALHARLPEPSIIHWHGLLLPSRMDGHPRDAIQSGQTYVYEFEVANRAGTYWYHPHPEPFTGGQVIRGLAGLFLVSDDEEAAAGLPSGDYDIPLVIQDRTLTKQSNCVC